jgi:hypothetical protein
MFSNLAELASTNPAAMPTLNPLAKPVRLVGVQDCLHLVVIFALEVLSLEYLTNW